MGQFGYLILARVSQARVDPPVIDEIVVCSLGVGWGGEVDAVGFACPFDRVEVAGKADHPWVEVWEDEGLAMETESKDHVPDQDQAGIRVKSEQRMERDWEPGPEPVPIPIHRRPTHPRRICSPARWNPSPDPR